MLEPALAEPLTRATGAEAESPPCLAAEPVVFGGHVGTLHRPTPEGARGLGLILCPPVGRDARCAYRPMWSFACALADRGFPVLRYDHLATGESLDLEPEADLWAHWLAGVDAAAAFVRAYAGVRGVVLGGVRLGASLAAAAAERVRPDGLLLLAPVKSGRAWTREILAASRLHPRPGADGPGEGLVEGDGVRLSPATLASLQSFDLRRLGDPGAAVFLATPEQSGSPPASLGTNVEHAWFEGYDALFRDSHVNAAPLALFDRAARWLETLPAARALPVPAPPAPAAGLATPSWTEQPVSFGSGLKGTLCLPSGEARPRSVIFGNTGGDPRGAGFAVQASRMLAGRGVASLRFDFAGLGESDGADGWRSHIYETPRAEDLRAAAALLRRHGSRQLVLAGVCSGAYHALRGAIEDGDVCGVLAVNATDFAWRPGEPFSVGDEQDPRSSRFFFQGLVRPASWRRLLGGEVDPRTVLQTVGRRLWRRLRARVHSPATRALRRELARLSARGVQIRILVGREDRALDELEVHFGRDGGWLSRRRGLSVAILPGLDHSLATHQSQALAAAELLRLVQACPDA